MDVAAAAEFDSLMRRHVSALYRYAFRWTGDVHQAEDLVQETLTHLFPELPQLRQIERLRPWAARVMYRIFIDNLRRARRSPVSTWVAAELPAHSSMTKTKMARPRTKPGSARAHRASAGT
jgi:RNA polymerase sigma-70 factor (ECF subfamily)